VPGVQCREVPVGGWVKEAGGGCVVPGGDRIQRRRQTSEVLSRVSLLSYKCHSGYLCRMDPGGREGE
jgi:hypothetical protein